jgi:hypothetical protein
LRSKATHLLAHLAQGVYVFMEGQEDNFGKNETIIVNKLKAILAKNGCSFVEDNAQADFKLTISANTRKLDTQPSDFVFVYADVVVGLYDNHKQKNVYHDEISIKGGSNALDRAARIALEDAAPKVAEKLHPWIENEN